MRSDREMLIQAKLNAPLALVWEAWTQPEAIAVWWALPALLTPFMPWSRKPEASGGSRCMRQTGSRFPTAANLLRYCPCNASCSGIITRITWPRSISSKTMMRQSSNGAWNSRPPKCLKRWLRSLKPMKVWRKMSKSYKIFSPQNKPFDALQ